MERRMIQIRSIIRSSILLLLLAACSQGGKPAEPTPTRLPLSPEEQTKAEQIDAYYTQLTQEGRFSGAMLVETRGKIILDKGYGLADRQKGIPNTIQTRFRLFNASKPFTTIGILKLEEQGKLNLSDPICKYLDDCPAKWKEFRIENLLTGTTGLNDYTMITPIQKKWDQPIARADLYNLLKSVNIDAPVMVGGWEGATDYALLGLIIERASGETYEDFLKKHIIEALGLKNTGFVHGQGEKDHLAIFYQGKETEPIAPAIDMSNLVGYGSAYSSAEDLLTLMKAIQSYRLLSKENTTRMLSPDEHWVGYDWLIMEFAGNTWITNFIGFAHSRSQTAIFAWTANGAWALAVLANQQDVNTVLHPQYITCLPGHPGGTETWVGYTECGP